MGAPVATRAGGGPIAAVLVVPDRGPGLSGGRVGRRVADGQRRVAGFGLGVGRVGRAGEAKPGGADGSAVPERELAGRVDRVGLSRQGREATDGPAPVRAGTMGRSRAVGRVRAAASAATRARRGPRRRRANGGARRGVCTQAVPRGGGGAGYGFHTRAVPRAGPGAGGRNPVSRGARRLPGADGAGGLAVRPVARPAVLFTPKTHGASVSRHAPRIARSGIFPAHILRAAGEGFALTGCGCGRYPWQASMRTSLSAAAAAAGVRTGSLRQQACRGPTDSGPTREGL